ncbi:MAG: DUF1684 domain-containing protein [Dokdonella sp.]|nr:DUF1684 domain-containing protein [Dokdonella sp.]
MLKTGLLLAASFAGVQLMSAKIEGGKAPADYTKQIETWRAQRVERLKSPNGWLSLIGLHWLKDGKNTVGSAKDNDVVLAKGPSRLGTITLKDGKATIELDAKAAASIDGKPEKSAVLLDDSHEKPTTIAFGTASFYLIDRNGKKGLRVKDSEAQTRKQFLGIDNYAIDPSWRIEAKWEAYQPPHTLEIPTVLGTVDKMPVPGKAVFERDGKKYELLPVLEEKDAKELFFIFADRTSGKDTYGAGRFLYADMPKDGKVVIDFNKAYNPPCAFTPHATCPLAPPENRLDLTITAGEKKYRGSHH